MDTHLTETWEKSINIIKGELTEVSFNTWIKSINPISLENNSLKLLCQTILQKESLKVDTKIL